MVGKFIMLMSLAERSARVFKPTKDGLTLLHGRNEEGGLQIEAHPSVPLGRFKGFKGKAEALMTVWMYFES
jgi:hypothetical protein